MKLPEYVAACIARLEDAGFAAYAVGGCVRDSLLGLTPQDYDLCTAATPEQIKEVFSDHRLVTAGEKHGTVAVLTGGGMVEITTFRLEGGYTDSRHPDWVRFSAEVTEDLSRRDFTVNAMAYSPTRGFADPFGGRADLENRTLRAVGDPATRFTEDALRILRGVRFAVRYRLAPEAATLSAMLSLSPLMDKLARERVFEELCKLLPLVTAADLLHYAPVLIQVLPELAPTVDFDQRSPYHAYDLYAHTAHVVELTPPVLPLRLAALLHDIGKVATFTADDSGIGHFPGHAKVSAEMADTALLRLKSPTALRRQVVSLIEWHMTYLAPDRRVLRRRLNQLGFAGVRELLALQEADLMGTGTFENTDELTQTAAILDELEAEDACLKIKDLAIDGKDLLALGYAPGKALGACLEALLSRVLDETLPNEKAALLQAAKELEDTL